MRAQSKRGTKITESEEVVSINDIGELIQLKIDFKYTTALETTVHQLLLLMNKMQTIIMAKGEQKKVAVRIFYQLPSLVRLFSKVAVYLHVLNNMVILQVFQSERTSIPSGTRCENREFLRKIFFMCL